MVGPHTGGGNLVVPIVLWGRNPPTHSVSCVTFTSDHQCVITGCHDGQLCVWDIRPDGQIYPRALLLGHSSAIRCLCIGSYTRAYIVSSSECGEMCLWDIKDGRCLESRKTSTVHTAVQAHRMCDSRDVQLVCNGEYPEILIVDPLTLTVQFTLISRVHPDWISAVAILRPMKRDDDVVIAISNSGTIKLWSVGSAQTSKSRTLYEDESKQIRCLDARMLRCCPYNQRTVLIVCSKYWQIYDAGEFSLLCTETSTHGARWTGGDFVAVNRVCVWSTDGRAHLYLLPTNANPEQPDFHRLVGAKSVQQACPSVYCLLTVDSSMLGYQTAFACTQTQAGGHAVVRGDSTGAIYLWKLAPATPAAASNGGSYQAVAGRADSSSDELPRLLPDASMSMDEAWCETKPLGFSDGVAAQDGPDCYGYSAADDDDTSEGGGDAMHITASLYLARHDVIVLGCSSGAIIVAPAVPLAAIQLLQRTATGLNGRLDSALPLHRTMCGGHRGRVSCLVCPHEEDPRYEPNRLLSGGADFSVILWDMAVGSILHVFAVHAGEVLHFCLPPPECNPRIASCVCSVANDHSVALLSIKEQKCLLFAGRHMFPVTIIRWRPLQDFMIVGCSDGTVYVWEMDTGMLDRVVHGATADEMLHAGGDDPSATEDMLNSQISIAQAFRRRNLATFRNLALQKMQQLDGSADGFDDASNSQQQQQATTSMPQPLQVQGLRLHHTDADAHLMFFDVEALIVRLLCEEHGLTSDDVSNWAASLRSVASTAKLRGRNDSQVFADVEQKLNEFIALVKDGAETASKQVSSKMDSIGLQLQELEMSPRQKERSTSFLRQQDATAVDSAATGAPSALGPSLPTRAPSSVQGAGGGRPASNGARQQTSKKDASSSSIGGRTATRGLPSTSSAGAAGSLLVGMVAASSSTTLCAAQLLLSCLHAWGLDADLDRVCSEQLGMSHPRQPVSFGLLSHAGHMLVLLPTWQKAIAGAVHDDSGSAGSAAPTGSDREPVARRSSVAACSATTAMDAQTVAACGEFWVSDAVTTQHLLAVIALTNTLMSCEFSAVTNGDRRARASSKAGRSYSANRSNDVVDAAFGGDLQGKLQLVRQGWSQLAALHCVLLPEFMDKRLYRPPELHLLANRWQDRCLEVREAAQALLLAELRRIGAEGRRQLALQWAPYMPELHDGQNGVITMVPDTAADDDVSDGTPKSSSDERKRLEATAIVILGIVGSEFGADMECNLSRRQSVDYNLAATATPPLHEALGGGYSLAWQTSKALSYLLLNPADCRLPLYAPIRRAAIDLIGRGFAVWEPHVDVSAILLGLLDLCIDGEKVLNSHSSDVLLGPQADACRTAHRALSLIATARPAAFLTTLAKEVARYNASATGAAAAQSAQHPLINSTTVLIKTKQEILSILELLIDRAPVDVADLLVETMDIVIHCLDPNVVKAKGLQETFPALCRFSTVSCCSSTRRICVGSKMGTLSFYELKQTKAQSIPFQASPAQAMMLYLKPQTKETLNAHSGPITAVAFAPDGKYLASFSLHEGKLSFWQSTSSTLFNIGSQHTKCIKTHVVPGLPKSSSGSGSGQYQLVWQDAKVVVLHRPDGPDVRFKV